MSILWFCWNEKLCSLDGVSVVICNGIALLFQVYGIYREMPSVFPLPLTVDQYRRSTEYSSTFSSRPTTVRYFIGLVSWLPGNSLNLFPIVQIFFYMIKEIPLTFDKSLLWLSDHWGQVTTDLTYRLMIDPYKIDKYLDFERGRITWLNVLWDYFFGR